MRSRTQYAVGTINNKLARMVKTAITLEKRNVSQNFGSANASW